MQHMPQVPRDRKRNLQPSCRSSTHLQHSQYVYSPLKAQELAARALAMPLAAVLSRWSVPVLTARRSFRIDLRKRVRVWYTNTSRERMPAAMQSPVHGET